MKIQLLTYKQISLFLSFIMGFLLVNCFNKSANETQGEKQMPPLNIEQVQQKYQDKIMAIPGVVGIAIGAVDSQKVIKVLVVKKTEKLLKKIPDNLEGYSVLIEETGEIRALER